MPDWDGRPESRHTSRDNDDSMSTFDEVKVEQPHEGHSLYHDEERQDQSNYEGRSHSDHGNDDGRLNDDRANFHEDQLHDDYRKFEEVPVHRGPEYSSRDSDFSEHFKGPSREEERNPQRDVNNNYDQPSNDERESSPRESENMQSNSKDEDGADSNMYDDHSHRTGEGRHNVPRVEYETEQDSTADPEADEKYEESNNGPD